MHFIFLVDVPLKRSGTIVSCHLDGVWYKCNYVFVHNQTVVSFTRSTLWHLEKYLEMDKQLLGAVRPSVSFRCDSNAGRNDVKEEKKNCECGWARERQRRRCYIGIETVLVHKIDSTSGTPAVYWAHKGGCNADDVNIKREANREETGSSATRTQKPSLSHPKRQIYGCASANTEWFCETQLLHDPFRRIAGSGDSQSSTKYQSRKIAQTGERRSTRGNIFFGEKHTFGSRPFCIDVGIVEPANDKMRAIKYRQPHFFSILNIRV